MRYDEMQREDKDNCLICWKQERKCSGDLFGEERMKMMRVGGSRLELTIKEEIKKERN